MEYPRRHALILAAALALLPRLAAAQGEAPAAVSDTERLDALEAELARMRAENEKKVAGLEQEVAALKESQEEAQLAQIEAGAEEKKLLTVSGYFDARFAKGFWDKNSLYNMYVGGTYSSFLLTNAHLYVNSQMTRTLSALLELNFNYLPLGEVNEEEYVLRRADGTEITVGSYDRVDPRLVDLGSSTFFYESGVMIERVYLQYSPFDWLNVIVGRFLTPYGIWNVDHGAPVILTVVTPYMQLREIVPTYQTGIEVFGRLRMPASFFLDYALTVSNGRNWQGQDAIQDFDENKGLGAKLKLVRNSAKLNVAAGGYVYYGGVSDVQRRIVIEVNDDMSTNTDAETPMASELKYTVKGDEFVASGDLLLEFLGVRLQGEIVWGKMMFDNAYPIDSLHAAYFGVPFGDTVYYGDYTSFGYYGLAGWTLPLDKWISPVKITPYFMYEYNEWLDMPPYATFRTITGGVNLRPSPYVVIKLEGMYGMPEKKDLYGDDIKLLQAQLAVSF